MFQTLATLINRLAYETLEEHGVLGWGAPVPAFGNPQHAKMATVGINPSNREFVDAAGHELRGSARRFHSLASLEIPSWLDVDSGHLDRVLGSCEQYFSVNPYEGWFNRMDEVLRSTGYSLYGEEAMACHLDLLPYATVDKWTDLSTRTRGILLDSTSDVLGLLLRDSSIGLLVLNGRTVVDRFSELSDAALTRRKMPGWSLRRRVGAGVPGYSYVGEVSRIGRIGIGRSVRVIGYNHNIQSSFGVTRRVIDNIQRWVGRRTAEFF